MDGIPYRPSPRSEGSFGLSAIHRWEGSEKIFPPGTIDPETRQMTIDVGILEIQYESDIASIDN